MFLHSWHRWKWRLALNGFLRDLNKAWWWWWRCSNAAYKLAIGVTAGATVTQSARDAVKIVKKCRLMNIFSTNKSIESEKTQLAEKPMHLPCFYFRRKTAISAFQSKKKKKKVNWKWSWTSWEKKRENQTRRSLIMSESGTFARQSLLISCYVGASAAASDPQARSRQSSDDISHQVGEGQQMWNFREVSHHLVQKKTVYFYSRT